jgi:surfeit locus 1 family protein
VSAVRTLRFWIISLAALATVAATLALGAWQLDRGRQREALHAAIGQRGALPPLGNAALLGDVAAEDLMHRPIVVRGTWAARHTVFLDNRQMNGRQGFFVVTPLLLEGSRSAVLVERGWAPRNFERRSELPPVASPPGIVEIRGRIAPLPAKLYEFDGAPSGPIRQNLDLGRFAAETGLPLLAVAVRQTGDGAPDGLLRQWPEPASGAGKNYGYAFQWWALAAVTAILYVWFQFIAPRRKVPPA